MSVLGTNKTVVTIPFSRGLGLSGRGLSSPLSRIRSLLTMTVLHEFKRLNTQTSVLDILLLKYGQRLL